jgi:hemophore-related protein
MTWTTRLIVACGGLAAAVTAATGTAGAQPDVDAVVNSTCTYPQVVAALNDQAPDSAADPQVTGWLQQLIASPPDGRRAMVAQVEALPTLQSYSGLITQIAHTCNNY